MPVQQQQAAQREPQTGVVIGPFGTEDHPFQVLVEKPPAQLVHVAAHGSRWAAVPFAALPVSVVVSPLMTHGSAARALSFAVTSMSRRAKMCCSSAVTVPSMMRMASGTIDRELATRMCAGCPVRTECLEFELRIDGEQTVGVWGALNEEDRRALHEVWSRRRIGATSLESHA